MLRNVLIVVIIISKLLTLHFNGIERTKMEKECRGCYLSRILSHDPFKRYDPDEVSCEHEKLNCPCKECLVKVMCNMIENGSHCEEWIDFNMKYNKNDYWEKKRKEKYHGKT